MRMRSSWSRRRSPRATRSLAISSAAQPATKYIWTWQPRFSTRDNRPVAVLILRSDPEQFLYPLIQSWPTPSRSAETLLVRRDGDDVLFLNKLRHRPDPALTLRIPLSRPTFRPSRRPSGQTGAFEGRDNRGVKVLAEILPVPGSPWFMVAKVDADEILAEARYRGRFILLFTALSMLVTGAMAAFVFSFRQKTLYQNLYRAEQGRRQVEEEIRATFYSIGDGVISTDAAGRVTRMNPVAEQLTGWSEAEALGKPVGAGLPHCQRRDAGPRSTTRSSASCAKERS